MIGMTVDERLWIQYRGVTRTYTCLIRARYNRVCSRACYLPDEPRPIANRRWSNPRLDVTRDAVLLPAYHQTRRRLGSSDDDVGETACLVLTEGGIRNNSDSNDIRNRDRERKGIDSTLGPNSRTSSSVRIVSSLSPSLKIYKSSF